MSDFQEIRKPEKGSIGVPGSTPTPNGAHVKTRIIGIGAGLLFAVAALSGCATQAGAADELAANDVVAVVNVETSDVVEEVSETVEIQESELDLAIAGVEHSLRMMNEVMAAAEFSLSRIEWRPERIEIET